jgi:murein DD-endopeptidase MepM/ murein hydrolase activator NlpD
VRLLLLLRPEVPKLSAVRWRALVVVLAAGALVAPVFAARATADPNQERIDELRAAVGHASAEEAAILADLAEIRSERQRLDAKVRAFDDEMAAARATADAARAERETAAAEYLALSLQVDETEAELLATKEKFDAAAAAMYRGSGSGSTGPSLLFELNPEDIDTAQRYLADTSRRHQDDAQRYLDLKDELERQRGELADQRARAEELAAIAEEEEARVATLLEEQRAVREAARAAEEREEAALASIQARKDEFATELLRLEEESQRLREQFGGGGEGTAPGQLLRPVNAPITSGFGPRTHPITGFVRMHNGVDFGAAHGTPIRAAESGVVVVAGWNSGGFGNYVIINHGGGFQTLYAHQSSLAVGTGAQVSRGQVIGYVGSTGASTGPHLHWEVWVGGTPVNPVAYL